MAVSVEEHDQFRGEVHGGDGVRGHGKPPHHIDDVVLSPRRLAD